MEEIDVIELLKRVKEKREPMIIKAKCTLFYLQEIRADDEPIEIGNMYLSEENVSLVDVIDVNTKIKILDKPIIEELDVKISGGSLTDTNYTLLKTMEKVDEIIKHINKEEK